MIKKMTIQIGNWIEWINFFLSKGSIGSVLHSEAFASFNGRFVRDYETNEIEYIFPCFFDKVCIITPKTTKIPQWKAIFKCFSIPVWLLIYLNNFVCGCFWFWLKWCHIKFLWVGSIMNIFFAINTFYSTAKLKKPEAAKQKILLWIYLLKRG